MTMNTKVGIRVIVVTTATMGAHITTATICARIIGNMLTRGHANAIDGSEGLKHQDAINNKNNSYCAIHQTIS